MNGSDTWKVEFDQIGGPEVLSWKKRLIPSLERNQVLIKHHAIGVNFVDTYYRSGLYPAILPSGIGNEAAGVVEEIGDNVKDIKKGDRVAYALGPLGAYAEKRIIDAKFVVKLPEKVSFEQAASIMLKGLTVHYLFNSVYLVRSGQKILFHASSGGVGLIACQWARSLGVKLIGTVSSPEKAQVSKQNGAWETIDYTKEDIASRVLELTDNEKVPVVYDGVGKSTWESSLECLQPRGLMVSFGNASGPVTGIDLATLAQKGSLYVTRPILAHYMSTYEELNKASKELFELVGSGEINCGNPLKFSLKDAPLAHKELANRKRTGAIILIP